MEEQPNKTINLSEKTIKILEVVVGIVGGLGLWALLVFSGNTTDGLLKWSWVLLFAVLLLGARALERKMNRQFKVYRLWLLISLGVGLVFFALNGFVFHWFALS